MAKKIIIAEDNEDILFILDMILHEAGYSVEVMPEGSAIIERESDWPDLFILDKHMPVIDGLEICKYLKRKEETKDIPIIMISSYHNLKQEAAELGVDDFIEKPFNLKDLLHTVRQCIEKPSSVR
jgi:DNA-binding response OmpR family regulator